MNLPAPKALDPLRSLRSTLLHGTMRYKAILVLGAALFVLLLASCDWSGDLKQVDYDMRGTWECVEEIPLPGRPWKTAQGRIVLGHNSITIIDPVIHLWGFTPGIALEAYTEDGNLYIKDRGILQSPVSYRRWRSADFEVELFTLTGGGKPDETFKKVED